MMVGQKFWFVKPELLDNEEKTTNKPSYCVVDFFQCKRGLNVCQNFLLHACLRVLRLNQCPKIPYFGLVAYINVQLKPWSLTVHRYKLE